MSLNNHIRAWKPRSRRSQTVGYDWRTPPNQTPTQADPIETEKTTALVAELYARPPHEVGAMFYMWALVAAMRGM